MNVIIIDKVTNAESILIDNITEHQANLFCEQWGWNYDDGQKSFWLKIGENR